MDTLKLARKLINKDIDKLIQLTLLEIFLKDETLFYEIIHSKGIFHNEFTKMVSAQIFIYKDSYILNRTNKETLSLLSLLGYNKNKINISALTIKFNEIWKHKKGITNSGYAYKLLEPSKTLYALEKFISNYPQFSEDVILRASKEFFDRLPIERGMYKYAPKSETFILGNDNSAYLKDLCEEIEKRDKLSNLNIIDEYYEGI